MATTTKKSPAKKAAPKKTVVKKTTASKSVTKKTSPKKAASKKQAVRSFRVYRDSEAFTSFRITRQTVYWIILVSFIIFVQLWILKLQIEVAMLLDAQQLQIQQL